jgi:Zn-dependent peptidase ImmA (M78 family)
MRQGRLAAGLTLDAVARRLAASGQTITKAGLSKYENNRSVPKPSFLLQLAVVLGVRSSYFLTEPAVTIEWLSFRRHAALSQSRQEQIKASSAKVVEAQVWLYSTLYPKQKPQFPRPTKARVVPDAEEAAEALRKTWQLGEAPIESVTQSIEDHGGIVVGHHEEAVQFDGLSGRANRQFPIVVANLAVPADRRRYDLAHELGHLVMDFDGLPAKREEDLAHRFAAAFLVPARIAKAELGAKRRFLSPEELGLLKQKYGLSMQAWARRARDLSIIDAGHYRSLCMTFNARGWKRQEPVSFQGQEQPTRLQQMTLRALAEGIVTMEKAEELCPGCVEEAKAAPARAPSARPSARDLLRLPREDRNRVLAAAAAGAAKDYQSNRELTAFEAFGEGDLYGEPA